MHNRILTKTNVRLHDHGEHLATLSRGYQPNEGTYVKEDSIKPVFLNLAMLTFWARYFAEGADLCNVGCLAASLTLIN